MLLTGMKSVKSYRRAKLVDEPLVRLLIHEIWGLNTVETTKDDDIRGVDIKAVDTWGNLYVFDVKRNSGSRYNKDFTFTYINRLGIECNFERDFVFIDEYNCKVHFVHGDALCGYVYDEKTQKVVSKNDASRFVALPLSVIGSLSYYSHQLRDFEVQYLCRNRDENLFE